MQRAEGDEQRGNTALFDSRARIVADTTQAAREVVAEVYEVWDSDMLRIFQQAGIPRRTPPPRSADCSFDGRSARGKVPQITSPTNGVSYVLRAFKTTESSIPFRAVTDADAREVFWFVNETYVGKAVSGTAFLWPATPGTFIVRAVDDLGRAGSRELKVSVAQ